MKSDNIGGTWPDEWKELGRLIDEAIDRKYRYAPDPMPWVLPERVDVDNEGK